MPKFLLGRRQFALGAAAAATGLVLPGKALPGNALPVNLLVQTASGTDHPLDEKTRAAMAKLTASAQAEVEMKIASIFRKYGGRLSDEEKADVRRVMAESQEGLEKMRAFRLENGDQPADSFRAYRTEEKSGKDRGSKDGGGKEKPRDEKK
jgi:hypothetical protein